MAAKKEDKFIVINKKRIQELDDFLPKPGLFALGMHPEITAFIDALNRFEELYEDNIGPLNQKYWVCNQDEPYADRVIKIILEEESLKGSI